MSRNRYDSTEQMVKDYEKLKPDYQEKLYKYMKKMLEIQRMESRVDAEIHRREWEHSQRKDGSGVRCSYCGKYQDEVMRMIEGPDQIYICEECVEICSEIMEEELGGIR